MLTAKKKPCKLGTNASARVEYHGDDKYTAVDFALKGVMLETSELNAFLQEPRAHDLLFTSPQPGALAQPIFGALKALRVKDKVEGVHVDLVLNSSTTLKLAKCNIASIELEPQTGGLTSMSCQVQAMPKLDASIARLLEKLDCEIEVSIEQEQGELALEQKADAKAAKADAKAASEAAGKAVDKRIRAATAAKRKRARNGHAEAR